MTRSQILKESIIVLGLCLPIGGGLIAIVGVSVREYLMAQAALKLSPASETIWFDKASKVESNRGEISNYYQFRGGKHLGGDTTYAAPLESLTEEQVDELVNQKVTVHLASENFGIGGVPDRWLLAVEANGKQYLSVANVGEVYVNQKRQRLYWVWIFAAIGLMIIYAGCKVFIVNLRA